MPYYCLGSRRLIAQPERILLEVWATTAQTGTNQAGNSLSACEAFERASWETTGRETKTWKQLVEFELEKLGKTNLRNKVKLERTSWYETTSELERTGCETTGQGKLLIEHLNPKPQT